MPTITRRQRLPFPSCPRVYILLIQKGRLRSLETLPFPLGILSMLQPNDQQLAVHSLWGTKKRMISLFPELAEVISIPAIGDIRPIQIMNNEESTEDDLDVGDDDNLDSGDPLADEDSNFDDFDDEFDDDFQEEESDPDWEHPDDLRPEAPPPSKSPGGKK